jgi:hypothetical protein
MSKGVGKRHYPLSEASRSTVRVKVPCISFSEEAVVEALGSFYLVLVFWLST